MYSIANHRALGVALLSIALLIPQYSFACRNMVRVRTAEEKLAGAELVFSGKVTETFAGDEDGPYSAEIEVLKPIKGDAGKTVRAPVLPPSRHPCNVNPEIRVEPGEWWTFYLSRNGEDGRYLVTDVEAFCDGHGTPAKDAPLGYCKVVLEKEIQARRLRMAAHSEAVIGPDRDLQKVWAVVLAAGSSFDGIALPPGTLSVSNRWHDYLRLSKDLSIGPIRLGGQVSLGNFGDSNHGESQDLYFAAADGGKVRLEGVAADRVEFRMPGAKVVRAQFSKPVYLRGYYMMNYATFSEEGELETFRSGRDQLVKGVRLKKCADVRIEKGKPIASPDIPCDALF